jgi:hypothetical protein
METQTYANHRHQPRLNGLGFLFTLVAIVAFAVRGYGIGGRFMTGLGLVCLIGAILTLLVMSRLYVTRLQDRIIKLEMRVRASEGLTPSQRATLTQLTKPQIIALRFASDRELPGLIERAERENLSGDQIKRAITNWTPDWDRT